MNRIMGHITSLSTLTLQMKTNIDEIARRIDQKDYMTAAFVLGQINESGIEINLLSKLLQNELWLENQAEKIDEKKN
ncbi:MAG: hypothetical protein WC511_01910 [Candidatus Pacearchaeota archaeon]